MISELNQRASILAPTLTPDGGGGAGESWNVAATIWVRLESLSGDEAFVAQGVRSRARYRITARRNAAILPACRIAIGTRTFRIHAVLNAGGDYLTLQCEELP